MMDQQVGLLMHAGALMLTLWCLAVAANSPTKTIGSVSRQYFTFTDVDFYNPKLEAVKRKVKGEYNRCMHLSFRLKLQSECEIIIHHLEWLGTGTTCCIRFLASN